MPLELNNKTKLKTRSYNMLPTRVSFSCSGHTSVENEEIGKDFPGNHNHKRTSMAILTSDKLDFHSKSVTGDKEGHYVVNSMGVYSNCKYTHT